MCGAYLIDRVPLGAKHFLTLYYLLDIYGDRETWNFDRSEAFNRRFICGSTSPWLYDFSLAVWLIDAGDFVVGKSHFLRALNRGGSWSESPSLWSDLFTEIWKRLGSPSASLTHSLVINEAKRPESDFEQIYSVLSTAKHMEETGDISGATAYLKRNFTEKSLVKLVDFKYDSEMEKWLKDQIFTHGWNGLTGSEALFWFSSRRAQYKDAVDSQNRQKIGKRRAEDSSCETLAKRLEDILPECRYAKLRKVGPSSLEMILQSFTNTAEVNVLSADISTATTSTLCRTASEEICKQLRTATPRRNINSPNVSPLKQFTPPKVNEASDLTQTLTDLFALTESGRKLSVEKSKLLLAVNPQEHRTKLSEIQSLLATPPAVGRTKSLGLGSSGLRVFPAAPILRLRETSPISTHSSGQKHLRFDLPRDSPAERYRIVA